MWPSFSELQEWRLWGKPAAAGGRAEAKVWEAIWVTCLILPRPFLWCLATVGTWLQFPHVCEGGNNVAHRAWCARWCGSSKRCFFLFFCFVLVLWWSHFKGRVEFLNPLLDSVRGFMLEMGSVGWGPGNFPSSHGVEAPEEGPSGHWKSLCLADRSSPLMFLMLVVQSGGSLQKRNVASWASGRNSAL